MTVNYTTNLGLGLPVTGTESGLWGDIVNNQITSLVDTAISGTTSVAVTTVDVTLTATQGAANQARSMVITLTGASTAARNVICPAVSKIYIVRNTTTGGFAHTFKTSAGTGISVPNGREMFLYCDGTNVVEAFDNHNTLAVGGNAISLGGALTTASSLTTSGANALTLTTTGSTNVTLPTTGTLATTSQLAVTGQAFTSSGTFTVPAGVTAVRVTVVGAGGGSGGGYFTAGCPPTSNAGGMGAPGGFTVSYISGLVAGTLTVTVGTAGANGTGNGTVSPTAGTGGGTSSVSSGTNNTISTVQATGGGGGTAGTVATAGTAGTTGVGSGSTISLNSTTTRPYNFYSGLYGGYGLFTPALTPTAGFVLIEY